MFNTIEECSRQFANYFITQKSETIDVELKDIFSRYTNDVIAATTFGLKIDSLREQNNQFYRMGKAYANFNGAAFFKVFLFTLFTTPMKVRKKSPPSQPFTITFYSVTRCESIS